MVLLLIFPFFLTFKISLVENFKLNVSIRLPRWFSDKDSTCQCRRRGFDPCGNYTHTKKIQFGWIVQLCIYKALFWMSVTGAFFPKLFQWCLTLQPSGLQPARLLCPWDSPSQNTGVSCHALLQGNLQNPGIKPTSLKCPALACGFFTTSAT